MAFTGYNTVNGLILGEVSDASGSLPKDYLTDALGSVVATVVNGAVQNTYRHAGYGQQVSKTGGGADPKYLWVGGWGYRQGYVRRRRYLPSAGSWTSVDPLWPAEPQYAYSGSRPTSSIDPSGLFRLDFVTLCGQQMYRVVPEGGDALGIASGLANRPAIISGPDAINYCKPAFPEFRGSTIVINGSLFDTGSGMPLGAVIDCLGRSSSGIDPAEPGRTIQYDFGKGFVRPRRLFEPNGDCAIQLVPNARGRDARTVIVRSEWGDIIYVIPKAPGMTAKELCSCFPRIKGRRVSDTYHLDGGSSTQLYYQAYDGAPYLQLCCGSVRSVNNWLWLRTRTFVVPVPTKNLERLHSC